MADSRSSSVQDQTRTQSPSPRAKGQDTLTPRRQTSAGLQRYGADPFSGSPLQLFRRITDEMDRVFDRALGGGLSRAGSFPDFSAPAFSAMWAPRIEAFQNGDEFIVRAELPGLKKEDVRVNVTDDAIVIEGERRDESEDRREGYYHTERSYGSFYRAIPLPEGAIGDKADATFKDGVLEVKLHAPPHEVTRGRRIDIK
jgi:HSP20 family protein